MSEPSLSDAFSLKDMLLSVIAKLDRLDVKLDTKADEAVVQNMEQRLSMSERLQQVAETRAAIVLPQIAEMRAELVSLKETAASARVLETYKRWLFGVTFASLFGLALTLLQSSGVLGK